MKEQFMRLILALGLLLLSSSVFAQIIPQWEKGYLDIHQVSTGNGNASFVVFPDGTTVLIDVGDLDKVRFQKKYFPMKVSPNLPDSSYSTSDVIKNYIDRVCGSTLEAIDYFILTHYHSDHYGELRKESEKSKNGDYFQTGISELGDMISIRNFIVRDYPNNVPAILKRNTEDANSGYLNLLKFIESQKKKGMKLTCVKAGTKDQIKPLRNDIPEFHIQNIKNNNLVWTGIRECTKAIFPYSKFNGPESFENMLSSAFVIQYGDFRYYFGGDNTGLNDQDHLWCDSETPMAKVIDQVNAMILNHHGNRDATNRGFLEKLDPQVVVMPVWCSDQPGAEVAMRLISPNIGTRKRKIFMTYYHPETTIAIGPWFEKEVTSKQGHIAIRVSPNGDYKVYVLDDTDLSLNVMSTYTFSSGER